MSSILAKLFGKSNENDSKQSEKTSEKSGDTNDEVNVEETSTEEQNEKIIENDSSQDENNKCKESDEKQSSNVADIESPPQIGLFNFIKAPNVCRPGQQPDRNGVCRDAW